MQPEFEKTDLAYPIGKHQMHAAFNNNWVFKAINDLHDLPNLLECCTKNLNQLQLQTTYRPNGWTLNQVVHHLADSHMNAYIRFKLGLTENNPTIKPYQEALWANLLENSVTPISVSVQLISAIHIRWVNTLNTMTENDFNRTVFHPQYQSTFTLWQYLSLYQWHSKHHLAHITQTIKSNKW